MVPIGAAAALVGSPGFAIACFALFVFAASLPYGNASAAIQEMTPNQMRGQLSALYILGINLAGIGLGPTVIALLSRVFGGDAALGSAMAMVIVAGATLSAIVLFSAGHSFRHAIAARTIDAPVTVFDPIPGR